LVYRVSADKISDTAHLVIDAVTARIGTFGRVETTELCAKKSDGTFACVTGDQLSVLLNPAAAPSAPTALPTEGAPNSYPTDTPPSDTIFPTNAEPTAQPSQSPTPPPSAIRAHDCPSGKSP